MAAKEKYSNFIHLSVAVVQSATDMIEQIGMLKGIRRGCIPESHEPWQMRDLRDAIQKASRALENYDACIARELGDTTSNDFDNAADSTKSQAA